MVFVHYRYPIRVSIPSGIKWIQRRGYTIRLWHPTDRSAGRRLSGFMEAPPDFSEGTIY